MPRDRSARRTMEAAELLAERVIFDIAGIPVMLGSDRARAFVEGVIKLRKRLDRNMVSFLYPVQEGGASASSGPRRQGRPAAVPLGVVFDCPGCRCNKKMTD